jgi:tetratricopeptide (TPR) repeat protein
MRAPRLLLAATVAIGLAGAIGLQVARERWYPSIASPVDELYFTSGEAVGRMALSYKTLLADIYWIRAVQYFGSTRLGNKAAGADNAPNPSSKYDLLYPLLDVTTTLDPQFNIAYRFGAIFLAEGYPNGPGRPDLAVKLLDKGTALNPRKWQYLYDKAFVYYWALRNPREAAHWFSEAAKIPGSPDWMPGLAAFMLSQGGDRRSARFMWQQILETADHEYMRKNAVRHLAELDLLDLVDAVNLRLDRDAQMRGARATTWTPLIQEGLLRSVPVDPDGVPLVIDPATGHATLPRESQYYDFLRAAMASPDAHTGLATP